MQQGLLFKPPKALKRLGEHLFLKCPLYRAKKAVRPLYINQELFSQFVVPGTHSWEEMSDALSTLFSITLDKAASDEEQVGWAYVDRQKDPLGISLLGNEGSGRAYYAGELFNIKGEKTPLATSESSSHSNGVLKMENGIWYSIIANSLYQELPLSPVLAVLDLRETFKDPETDQEEDRVKVIRLDMGGSLDRITHLFYLKKPCNKESFLAMAQAFGQLDARKYMGRIEHGSWSSGNSSPEGHLIDYDTVCVVKGRHPQFSGSPRYIDNFFSFEHLGQLKILESLLQDPEINVDKLSLEELRKALLASRFKELKIQLLQLMGFDADWTEEYAEELAVLLEQIEHLSRYTRYISERSFHVNVPLHLLSHLFDFSTFFRYYPLLKSNKKFSSELGLKLLVQTNLAIEEDQALIRGTFPQAPLRPEVLPHLSKYFVNEESKGEELAAVALNFIEAFDSLYEKLLKEHKIPRSRTVLQAYLINEDRFYLLPVFDLTRVIAHRALTQPAHEIHLLIELIIASGKRRPIGPKQSHLMSNMRLYEEGVNYLEFDQKAHFQIVFRVKKYFLHDNLEAYTLGFNEQIHSACVSKDQNEEVEFRSPPLPMKELITSSCRDVPFKVNHCALYYDGNLVFLHDYYHSVPTQKYHI